MQLFTVVLMPADGTGALGTVTLRVRAHDASEAEIIGDQAARALGPWGTLHVDDIEGGR